jgi:hypothetical protein
MSSKEKPDLVTGRLSGRDAADEPKPVDRMRKAGNYGSNRLGLRADDEQPLPTDGQDAALNKPDNLPDAPETDAESPVTALARNLPPALAQRLAASPSAKPAAAKAPPLIPSFDFREPRTAQTAPQRKISDAIPAIKTTVARTRLDGRHKTVFAAAAAALLLVALGLTLGDDSTPAPASGEQLIADLPNSRVVTDPVVEPSPGPLSLAELDDVSAPEPLPGPSATRPTSRRAPAPTAPQTQAPLVEPPPRRQTSPADAAIAVAGPEGVRLVNPATVIAEPEADEDAATEQAKPKVYRSCPDGLRLSGVIRRAGGGFANINGKYYSPGERVSGATLVEIRDFAVEMKMGEEYFLLPVSSGPAPVEKDEPPVEGDQEHSSQDDQADEAQDSPAEQ